jgi:hypothetical protein
MIFAPVTPVLDFERKPSVTVQEKQPISKEVLPQKEEPLIQKSRRELGDIKIQNESSINHMYQIMSSTEYFKTEENNEFLVKIDAFYNDIIKNFLDGILLNIADLEKLFVTPIPHSDPDILVFPYILDYSLSDLSHKSNLNDLVTFFLSWVYKFLITDDNIKDLVKLDGDEIVKKLDSKYNFIRITTENRVRDYDVFKQGNPFDLKGALSKISYGVWVRVPKVDFVLYNELCRMLRTYRSGFSVTDFMNAMFKKYYGVDDYYNNVGKLIDGNDGVPVSPEQHVLLNYVLRYANDTYAMLISAGLDDATFDCIQSGNCEEYSKNEKTLSTFNAIVNNIKQKYGTPFYNRIKYGLYLTCILLMNFVSKRRLESFIKADQDIQEALGTDIVIHTIEGVDRNYTFISMDMPVIGENGMIPEERKSKIKSILTILYENTTNELYKSEIDRTIKSI